MSARKEEEYSLFYSFLPGFLLSVLMWLITILANVYDYNIGRLGLYPGSPSGLIGIITTPFLHRDFLHLFSNTFPLILLSAMLFYSYRKVSVWVLLGSFLLTGLGTWLIARPAYHIGASGIVYALASFLLFSGIFRRDRSSGAISFIIMFLYSSMIYGVFPSDEKISWESHAIGGVAGLLLAFVFRNVNLPVKEEVAMPEPEVDFEAQIKATQALLEEQRQQHLAYLNRLQQLQQPALESYSANTLEPEEPAKPMPPRINFTSVSPGQTVYRYIYQPEIKPTDKPKQA